MKKNNIIKILILLLVLFTNSTIAQTNVLPCGNGIINETANTNAKNFLLNNRNALLSNYVIRVFFNVFTYNDGTNPGATPAQIESEFLSLKASYVANNVCFVNMGVRYINNSSLDSNFNADTDPTGSALSTYQVAGCINIFYMRKIKGTNTACNPPCGYGGIALGGIPGTFFLVATGNIGASNTIGHEMGHSLGLLHTFEPYYGYEKINGANSATAADQITDTNADPYAYSANSCYSATACNYTGSCTDPNGASNFSPPYTNLMSYWGSGCGNPVASNGQFTRVNSFLGSTAALIACSSPSSITLSNINISINDYYLKSATNLVQTNNSVIVQGSTKAVLAGGIVIVNSGFQALPNSIGYTILTSTICD
jgi:hypothetical protein